LGSGALYNEGGIISVAHSLFQQNRYALDHAFGTTSVIQSVFLNNDQYGIYTSSDPSVVSAEDNWWGTITGPYHPTLNPDGLGDALSGNVSFIPWLNSPPN